MKGCQQGSAWRGIVVKPLLPSAENLQKICQLQCIASTSRLWRVHLALVVLTQEVLPNADHFHMKLQLLLLLVAAAFCFYRRSTDSTFEQFDTSEHRIIGFASHTGGETNKVCVYNRNANQIDYDYETTFWTPNPLDDDFGKHMAISGETIVIANGTTSFSADDQAIFVHNLVDGAWVLDAIIKTGKACEALDIDGDTIMLAYIDRFVTVVRGTDGWALGQVVALGDSYTCFASGSSKSASLSGDIIAIGDFCGDVVRVFRRGDSGDFAFEATLAGPADSYFGYAVDVDGITGAIIAGGYSYGSNAGIAQRWDFVDGAWAKTWEKTGAHIGDRCGTDVAIFNGVGVYSCPDEASVSDGTGLAIQVNAQGASMTYLPIDGVSFGDSMAFDNNTLVMTRSSFWTHGFYVENYDQPNCMGHTATTCTASSAGRTALALAGVLAMLALVF
ncbi:hypothetical protein J8273_3523 [Carpediemonas membranifera]|uniref:Uncharacterized protein n=1 Tax=Carpediemonas membranifera TaxID=201153 RepID=A0A8J6BAL4_9EUKA|nr:hypothetical protein J8273_3523 [Carpediemonas membranifera]|eukprot:KAG9393387.1 hypothetical protein J8273_3523 [Carpediemonas membranifera]